MHGRKTLNRHAALMNRMAQALGVNLTEMMLQGKLGGDDWREAVVRCSDCPEPTDCLHWLSEHDEESGRAKPAAEAPDYCTNREMMARLRAALAADQVLADAEGEK
ncbi:hypothetical protein H9N28_02140 [Rhodobacter capsulatus]|uniref:DUF6455 family protein n=2 Tax=Rhodobacter capsulatus TaxID=1061 RepID=UPI0006E57E6B|nr:DUF6455 family protein [Rhodobacter capsulatus]KQB13367.1 hypothetical protein AP073_04235 [Rhodobacter capsulatus]PZX24364.1 hypothetical protein LY44_02098 [Rhodobacter capsulatus]QNR63663.1 hypothetical protein H9N28_02140 [Rhodobacter capsulatus]